MGKIALWMLVGGVVGFVVAVSMDWMWIGMLSLCVLCGSPVVAAVGLARKRDRKPKPSTKMNEAAQKWQEKQNALTEALKENQPKKTAEIVSVKYLGGGTVQNKKYGMKGAMIGGFFGGVPGAVVGSVLPNGKQRQKEKFAVKYEDGSVRIVECWPNSNTYRELMKRMEWEEL